MSEIRFASKEHENFFFTMLHKCGNTDCYHRAFFYCVGISDTARNNVGRMFDFKQDCIKPEGRIAEYIELNSPMVTGAAG